VQGLGLIDVFLLAAFRAAAKQDDELRIRTVGAQVFLYLELHRLMVTDVLPMRKAIYPSNTCGWLAHPACGERGGIQGVARKLVNFDQTVSRNARPLLSLG